MEFEGRISRVLPVRSGTSQRGEWKALPFVFEYFENEDQRWADRVLLETFDTNIMAQIGQYLQKGQDGKVIYENDEAKLLAEIKCHIGFSHNVDNITRQDGTKTTVNRIRLYKFEIITGQQQQDQQQIANAPVPPQYQPPQQQVQAPFPPQQPTGGQNDDDLPF